MSCVWEEHGPGQMQVVCAEVLCKMSLESERRELKNWKLTLGNRGP